MFSLWPLRQRTLVKSHKGRENGMGSIPESTVRTALRILYPTDAVTYSF